MWGAASPTNPIKPVNEIIIDVMKADKIKILLRVLAGSTPVDIANPSPPIESVLRSHAHFIADGIMIITMRDIAMA